MDIDSIYEYYIYIIGRRSIHYITTGSQFYR